MFTLTEEKLDKLRIGLDEEDTKYVLKLWRGKSKTAKVTLSNLSRMYNDAYDSEIEDLVVCVLKSNASCLVFRDVEKCFSEIDGVNTTRSVKEQREFEKKVEKKVARVVYDALKDDKNWTKKELHICKGR